MPKHPDTSVRIRIQDEVLRGARIKIVGVGGGGNNAINRMIEAGMDGVEFISVNTDLQSLQTSRAQVRLQLGAQLTRGLGTGANPETGWRAALEDSGKIVEALRGADMVFITAGLGGGTGTGATPVIAALASQMGALTVAIVTRPFGFEGKRRMNRAEQGLQKLHDYVDTLIVIPNERLLTAAKDAGFFQSFQIVDDVLQQAVKSISDIITVPGVINRDFADVRAIMAGMGYGVMGTASRTGSKRAAEAALAAIASQLLEAGGIDGALGILINITGSKSLKLSEVYEASTIIQEAAHEDANIIFGAVLDEGLGDEVKITIIATGFHQDGRDEVGIRERMLSDVEQPDIRFEEAFPQESHAVVQISASVSQETVPDGIGPVEALVTEKPYDEVDLHSSAVSYSYADDVEPQRIDAEALLSVEVPPFERDAEQEFSDVQLVDVPTPEYDEDLLAIIDGAPFDIDSSSNETTLVPTVDPPAQPEIVRLRQAALAAYTTAPMIDDDETEDPIVPEASSFAAILEGRKRALNVSPAEPSYRFDDEEMPSYLHLSVDPGQQSIAVIEAQWPLEDGAKGGPEIEDVSLRSAGLVEHATPGPSSASKPGNFPVFASSTSLVSRPKHLSADEPAASSTHTEVIAVPVPNLEHGLNRDTDFWREWELNESPSHLHMRIPSFASVNDPDELSIELDVLDIPAFLRHRT